VSPNDPRHGTTGGYDAHHRDHETPCAPCRAAAAAYEYERRTDAILGRPRTTSSLGTSRRIQALVALGYTLGHIGGALGRSQDWAAKLAHRQDSYVRTTTAQKVDTLYRSWCMAPPPEGTGAERWQAAYSRTIARKNGWAPPLAWDDIDHDESPNAGGLDDDQVDPVVVQRLLDGRHVVSNQAEKVEAMRRWRASGRSEKSLCDLHGWKCGRYVTREAGAA
jgi:hypothetical protein